MFSRVLGWIMAVLVMSGVVSVGAQSASGPTASATNLPSVNFSTTPRAAIGSSTNTDFQPLGFDVLASYPIKVSWLMNPTNSSFDTLRREGEIPGPIQALNGRKVAVQGYLLPLQQDAGGVREFLLMRDHGMCCRTNVPQINEWVHVRMQGKSLPFTHERQFLVRGELQVGEKLGAGNVVSVYRLSGEEISFAPEAH